MSIYSGFWHDEDFWECFTGIRTCFITGRLGSGKSLLSFALGHRAMQLRYSSGVYANIKHAFPLNYVVDLKVLPSGEDEVISYGDYEPRGPNDGVSVENAFTVIDEAWQIIDNRYSVGNFSFYGAWSRKSNTLWTFPSVYAIDKRTRAITVERIADVAILPIRMWIYRWMSADGRHGWFGLSSPERYWGTYKTKAVPLNDGGALDSLMRWAQRVAGEGELQLVQQGRNKSRRADGKPDIFTNKLIEATNDKISGIGNIVALFGTRMDELEKRIRELEERIDEYENARTAIISGASAVEDDNRWG